MKKLEILRSQLDEDIKWFEDQSGIHKRLYRGFRYSVFFLTAVSTVLASLIAASLLDSSANMAVVAVTALIGVLTSIEGLRKPAELWLNERSIYHALRDLKREVEYHSQGALDEKTLDAYFSRAQQVMSAGSAKWKQQVLSSKAGDEPKQGTPGDSQEKV